MPMALRLCAFASCIVMMACQSGPQDAPRPTTSKGGPDEGDDGDGGGGGSSPVPTPTSGPTSTGEPPGTTGTAEGSGTTGSAAATDAPAGTTDAPPTCGDGVVDPGETCDESFVQNSDHGACTSFCQHAVCGDALVWAGHEACDDGPDNNDTKWGGCTTTCELGPRCGDGVFQPDDEECDASAPPVEFSVTCDPDTCRFQARVAFVTAAEFNGQIGGLAAADAACVAAAQAAGLDNAPAFMAWLSDGVAAPATRLVDGAQALAYPYARRDGKRLAYDLKDLTTNGMQVPLDITEYGDTLPPLEYAWTNVHIHGEPFSQTDHCQGWTSQSAKLSARVGQISPATVADLTDWQLDGRWTSFAAQPCYFKAATHLYCFED